MVILNLLLRSPVISISFDRSDSVDGKSWCYIGVFYFDAGWSSHPGFDNAGNALL